MAAPTIAERLRKRVILMSADAGMRARVNEALPDGWELVTVTQLEELGEWHQVLLHRFLLLDLDEVDAFDPIDVIRALRMQYQINIPVYCFGGDKAVQEEMRLSRADRFFSRDELIAFLPKACAQFS